MDRDDAESATTLLAACSGLGVTEVKIKVGKVMVRAKFSTPLGRLVECVEPAPAPPASEPADDEQEEGEDEPEETPDERRERERKARLVPDGVDPDVLFGGKSK